jgi:hypothetical protein
MASEVERPSRVKAGLTRLITKWYAPSKSTNHGPAKLIKPLPSSYFKNLERRLTENRKGDETSEELRHETSPAEPEAKNIQAEPHLESDLRLSPGSKLITSISQTLTPWLPLTAGGIFKDLYYSSADKLPPKKDPFIERPPGDHDTTLAQTSTTQHSPENQLQQPLQEVQVFGYELGMLQRSRFNKIRTPYKYSPLANERQIRLLSIRRHSSDDDKYFYEIITATLDARPSYETVSYVWGNDHQKRYQLNFVDGSYLWITESMVQALPSLSKHQTTGYLWIDQLCIDQKNVTERNHQVKAMGDIYRNAVKVFVFLGRVATFNKLNRLIDIAIAVEQGKHEKPVEVLQSALAPFIPDTEPTKSNSGGVYWSCVLELLKHGWYVRAWVFQEVVLSESVLFVVNDRLIEFDAILRLALATSRIETNSLTLSVAGDCVTTSPGFLQLYAMAEARSQKILHGKPRDFWKLLSEIAPNSFSSEDKDIVYAFLGLLEDPGIDVQPNYEMTLCEVLMKTARSFAEGKQNLDVLGFVARDGSNESILEGVPTWAPDWRQHERVIPFTSTLNSLYDACAERLHTQTKMDREDSLRPELTVRGEVISEVKDIKFESAFTSSEHWTTRDLIKFLCLDDIIVQLPLVNSDLFQRPAYRIRYIARVLRVILADGILLFNGVGTAGYEPDIKLSNKQLWALAEAYVLLEQGMAVQSGQIRALRNLSRIAMNRRLFVGSEGNFGLAHDGVESGDLVAILHGSKTPVILRKTEEGRYQTLGQCYFEGVMYGEAVNWGEDQADEFVLV